MPDVPMPPSMPAEAKRVFFGTSHTHKVLRSRLATLFAVTLAIDAVGTVLAYAFEHDHARSGFHTLGGALFWVCAQLTTVSSILENPVTPAGKVLDVVLEVWAITAVATIAGAIGAFFTSRHAEHMRQVRDG